MAGTIAFEMIIKVTSDISPPSVSTFLPLYITFTTNVMIAVLINYAKVDFRAILI